MSFPYYLFSVTACLIAIEYFYIRSQRLHIYTWKENLVTLITFLGNYFAPLLGPYIPMSPHNVYLFYQAHLRVPEIYNLKWYGPEWLRWAFLFMAVDLAYYVSHRLAHKVNFFWAGHFTHHTISNLNIISAHRDPIRLLKIGPTLLLIPLTAQLPGHIGLEVAYTFLFISIYSTWMHSQIVPRIPYLDWIFNTPSSHRMHHSISNQDRTMAVNFGGVLIIWDRIFGTFLPEKQNQHVYGVQNFHKPAQLFPVLFFQWQQLFSELLRSRSIVDILWALFGNGPRDSKRLNQNDSGLSSYSHSQTSA